MKNEISRTPEKLTKPLAIPKTDPLAGRNGSHPDFTDIANITEYGMTQKLSFCIRVF